MTPSPSVDWILVADRSRARIVHALTGGMTPWPILVSFIHVEGRMSAQQQGRDAPGRVQHPGGARSAVEPHEDTVHVEARRFAAQLIELLERDCQEKRFDRLIVVAAPMFLGVLRDAWPALLRKLIVREVNLDVMGLDEPALQARLMQIVADINGEATR